MGKKGKFSLMTMLMVIGIVPLISISLLINLLVGSRIEEELKHEVEVKLEVACSGMEQYYSFQWGNIDANDYTYVDSLLEDEVVLTLFNGDTRLVSSIKDENGERIIGTKANDDVIQKVLIEGNDYFAEDVKINGATYFACYSPIKADGEIVGMAFAGEAVDDVNNVVSTMRMYMLGISVIGTLIFAIVIVLIAIKFKKPIQRVVGEINLIAKGELGSEIAIRSSVKEITKLVDSLTTIQENLRVIVQNTKNTADELSDSIKEVDDLSGTLNSSATQINTAVDELANAAVSMAENVQNVSGEIVNMGQNINLIAANVDVLGVSSKVIEEVSDKAKLYINEVMDSSERSVGAVRSIGEQIDSTNDSIAKINNAVEFIQGITNQTKLLSLNASIEAARAGESGRGFAVVADNIRQLSEQSSLGANQIKEIVDEIFGQSGKSVELAEEIRNIITEEQAKIVETQQCFMELKTEIEKSLTEINDISEKTMVLEDSKGKIIENVEDLSAISEENAASNEEVTASIQTMVSDIQVVSDRAEEMRELAAKLEEVISVFKL